MSQKFDVAKYSVVRYIAAFSSGGGGWWGGGAVVVVSRALSNDY